MFAVLLGVRRDCREESMSKVLWLANMKLEFVCGLASPPFRGPKLNLVSVKIVSRD